MNFPAKTKFVHKKYVQYESDKFLTQTLIWRLAAESCIFAAERQRSQLFVFYEISQPDKEYWKAIKNYLSNERTDVKREAKQQQQVTANNSRLFQP